MKKLSSLELGLLALLAVLLTLGAVGTAGPDGWAADYITGRQYQIGKLAEGVAGTANIVSSQNPLPVLSVLTGGGVYEPYSVFGRTGNADSGVATDIWSGAASTVIYVAPTVARLHTIVSADANDAAAAGTLTFAGVGGNGEIVTIGSKDYTLQTVLTNVDGHVLIGGSASDSLDNLIAAINLGSGSGTAYAAATTANAAPTTAKAGDGDTMTLYARTAIDTTTDVTGGSWGAATAVLGTGARTLTLYGLTDWDTAEVSETIYLMGVTGVVTTNSYVFINRLEVATSGATNRNTGAITATAASDGTVSASIPALLGVSQSAILGVPSVQDLYISGLDFAVLKAGATDIVDFSLLVNPEPDSQLVKFNTAALYCLTGTVGSQQDYNPPLRIPGPCVVKLQANSNTADSDVTGRINAVLVSN